jgi:hypothetical protein
LRICSFDIEASSSHGDFPVPIKSYKKLATNIIDCIDSKETEEKTGKTGKTGKTEETEEIEEKIELLKNILLTSFQKGNHVKHIDYVYPKYTPSFQE